MKFRAQKLRPFDLFEGVRKVDPADFRDEPFFPRLGNRDTYFVEAVPDDIDLINYIYAYGLPDIPDGKEVSIIYEAAFFKLEVYQGVIQDGRMRKCSEFSSLKDQGTTRFPKIPKLRPPSTWPLAKRQVSSIGDQGFGTPGSSRTQSLISFMIETNMSSRVVSTRFSQGNSRQPSRIYLHGSKELPPLSVPRVGCSSFIFGKHLFVVFGASNLPHQPGVHRSSSLPASFMALKNYIEPGLNSGNPGFQDLQISFPNNSEEVFENACIFPDQDAPGEFFIYGGWRPKQRTRDHPMFKMQVELDNHQKPWRITLRKLDFYLPKQCSFAQNLLLNRQYLREVGAYVMVDTEGEVHAFKPGQAPFVVQNHFR